MEQNALDEIKKNEFLSLEVVLQKACAASLRGEDISKIQKEASEFLWKNIKEGYVLDPNLFNFRKTDRNQTAALSCSILLGDVSLFDRLVEKMPQEGGNIISVHSTGHILYDIGPNLVLAPNLETMAARYLGFMNQLLKNHVPVPEEIYGARGEFREVFVPVKYSLEYARPVEDLQGEWLGPVFLALRARGQLESDLGRELLDKYFQGSKATALKKIRNCAKLEELLEPLRADNYVEEKTQEDKAIRDVTHFLGVSDLDNEYKRIIANAQEISKSQLIYLSYDKKTGKFTPNLSPFQTKGSEGILLGGGESTISLSGSYAVKYFYDYVPDERVRQQYYRQAFAGQFRFIHTAAEPNVAVSRLPPREQEILNEILSKRSDEITVETSFGSFDLRRQSYLINGIERDELILGGRLNHNDFDFIRRTSVQALLPYAYTQRAILMPRVWGKDLSEYSDEERLILRALYVGAIECQACSYSDEVGPYRNLAHLQILFGVFDPGKELEFFQDWDGKTNYSGHKLRNRSIDDLAYTAQKVRIEGEETSSKYTIGALAHELIQKENTAIIPVFLKNETRFNVVDL